MGAKCPLQLNLTSHAIYIQACLLTKQNFFLYFDAGLEHMATLRRCNETQSIFFFIFQETCNRQNINLHI